MNLVSYAQNYEDILLWRALRDVNHGTYLDIGAQHPDDDSVSKLFYERGWRGTHVEANAVYAELLRAARPDEPVIEALVTAAAGDGPAEFHLIPETGLSTGIPALAQRHAAQGHNVEIGLVTTITLDSILEGFVDRPVHWMKIDVEGMERDVLESWGKNPTRPWIIVIESTLPNSQLEAWEEWIDLIRERDYKEVFFDGLNRYFVHNSCPERAQAFRSPPNLFDGFAVTSHHFTAGLVNHQTNEALEAARRGAAAQAAEFQAAIAARDHTIALGEQHLSLTQNQLSESRQAVALADARLVNANAHSARQQAEFNARLDAASAELTALRGRHEEQLRNQREIDAAAGIRRDAEWQNRLDAVSAELVKQRQDHEEQISAQRERTEEAGAIRDREWKARLVALGEEKDRQHQTALDQLTIARAEALASLQTIIEAERYRADSAEARERTLFGELRVTQIALAEARNRLLLRTETLIGLQTRRFSKFARRFGIDLLADLNLDDDVSPAMQKQRSVGATQVNAPTIMTDLLNLHDREFVEQAYRSILGREGDPEGVAFYTKRIREGRSKLFVLKALRRSDEARNHIPGIAGLDAAIRRYRLTNLPLAGPALRWLWQIDGEGGHDQAMRASHARAAMLSRSIEALKESMSVHNLTLTPNHAAQVAETLPLSIGAPADCDDQRTTPSANRQGLPGFFQSRVWKY